MKLVTQIIELVFLGFELIFKGVIAAASYAAMLAIEVVKQEPWIIAVILGAIAFGVLRRKLRI